MIGSSPYALVVNAALPAKTVAELIALARTKQLTYASAGPASLAHLAGVLFSHMAKIELTDVPYRSSAQSVLDVVEGRIDMQFGTLAPTLPFIRSGRVRALAVTGARRSPSLPAILTLSEAGLTGYEASLWIGMVAPAATPTPVIERLDREMTAILSAPDTVAALDQQGTEAEPSSPQDFGRRIGSEITKWRALAGDSGTRAVP
jgi:tripartite-type tricarboxylate transporter receptor subunit TctC